MTLTIIIEVADKWCGIGIDWNQATKGFRLGYFALHWTPTPFEDIIEVCHIYFKEGRKV